MTRLAIVCTHPIQHFVPLYRSLARRLDLHVVYASRKGLEPYHDEEMNTSIAWKMDLTSGYAHTFATGQGGRGAPSIGQALAAFRPDAIVVYGYAEASARGALLWAKLRGIPVLMISDSVPHDRGSMFKSALKHVFLRLVATQVAFFLTTGDNNEAHWARYQVLRAKMIRAPFTIDEDSYRAARRDRLSLRRAWRLEHGIGEDEILLLTVGKLSARKRQTDALSALKALQDTGPCRLRAVFAGDGAEAPALRRQAADAQIPATFLGFVNVDALPQTYAAADLLLHPAEIDPHPLVLSEAACIGLPLVLADKVGAIGATDIAQPGVNAAVYPTGDHYALARLIQSLAQQPEEMDRMGRASVEVFEAQAVQSVDGVMTAIQKLRQVRGAR